MWLFSALHQEFSFTVDAAAVAESAKLSRYWSPHENGLVQSWENERVFCNPPFSNILPWVRKAHTSAGLAVLLLPVYSDTRWWHAHVLGAAEIRFLPRRLSFSLHGVKKKAGARFPCCIAVYHQGERHPYGLGRYMIPSEGRK